MRAKSSRKSSQLSCQESKAQDSMADSLEKSTNHEDEYMVSEKELLVNRGAEVRSTETQLSDLPRRMEKSREAEVEGSRGTEVPSTETQLNDLPDECLMLIMRSLGTMFIPGSVLPRGHRTRVENPLHCALVCKRWQSLANKSVHSLHLRNKPHSAPPMSDTALLQRFDSRFNNVAELVIDANTEESWRVFLRLASIATRLEHLEIHECIAQPVPTMRLALASWTRLTHLDLRWPIDKEDLKLVLEEVSKLPTLQHLNFCYRGDELPEVWGTASALTGLTSLELVSSDVPPASTGSCREILRKLLLVGFEGGRLPESLGLFVSLETLVVVAAYHIQTFPVSLSRLSRLTSLVIVGCFELVSLPDTLGQLSALQKLRINDCQRLVSLPDTVGQLSALQDLCLSECRCLVSLPDTLGQLSALQKLRVVNCNSLVSLPQSLGSLSLQLKSMSVHQCAMLTEYPAILGQHSVFSPLHSETGAPCFYANERLTREYGFTAVRE